MNQPPKGDLTCLGHVGGEFGTSYYRHVDGSIWSQCWGQWQRLTPAEAAAEILDWSPSYLAEVDAAPADEWANIERRRIAERRRLAALITIPPATEGDQR